MTDRDSGAALVVTAQLPAWIAPPVRVVIDGLLRDATRLGLMTLASEFAAVAGEITDSGQLAQSFGSVVSDISGSVVDGGALSGSVISPLPYAIVQMETGRRVGAPISRAGIDALGLWAQRKLGLDAAAADRAKWAIANAIVKRGLPKSDRADRAMEAGATRVDELFGVVLDQVSHALTQTEGPLGWFS